MEERIRAALREVVDPEIGINIVDLGLVYNVDLRDGAVHLQLTMTTQACPLHEYIAESAREAVRNAVPEVGDVDVEMVWDPPWSPEMMSADAKRQMGGYETRAINVKDTLAGLRGRLIMGAFLAVGLAIAGVCIFGAAWASTKLLPWFSDLTWVAFGIVVFILLPLAIPKATRGFSSVALFVASYVFGATLWMEGLLFTLAIWGVGAVFIGLFLAGVGVVPIAMLATLLTGMWVPLVELVLLTIMTFGSRIGAKSLAESLGA